MLQRLSTDLLPNESEERFRALAEASWEGICFSDNGIVLDANPQLAAMLGYTHGSSSAAASSISSRPIRWLR